MSPIFKQANLLKKYLYILACSSNLLLAFIRFSLTVSFLLGTSFAMQLSHSSDLAISLSLRRLETFGSFPVQNSLNRRQQEGGSTSQLL
jgi:hypothetical protein